MADSAIGGRMARREDRRFLTGKGRYTDDINRPGQLHAYFLRSPVAHARVRSIDTSAAEFASLVAGSAPTKHQSEFVAPPSAPCQQRSVATRPQ